MRACLVEKKCKTIYHIVLYYLSMHVFRNSDYDRELPQSQTAETSSPMGNDRSPWIQHNVWRHHNLQCSKADNSELETVTRN